MRFRERVAEAQSRSHSTLVIGLAPVLNRLPQSILRHDEPLLPFGKAAIDATVDLVCGYVFHLASYLALGAAGAVALERTIAYVPGSVIKILHGPFACPDYAPAASDDAFNVDAVTLARTADSRMIRPYVDLPQRGIFVESPEDLQPVLQMSVDYPDQVGIYRQNGSDQCMMRVLPAVPSIDWYWGSSIFTSQGDDFRDALRRAAEMLRNAPQE